MKMLLPFTLLLVACADDPHIAEISGLRGIIAQNDIDRAKVAEEMEIVTGDYETAKLESAKAWVRVTGLSVFALEYMKLAGIKADEVWVCRPEISDAHPEPRSPYITAEWSAECENSTSFRFDYDAAGNPSFEPEED